MLRNVGYSFTYFMNLNIIQTILSEKGKLFQLLQIFELQHKFLDNKVDSVLVKNSPFLCFFQNIQPASPNIASTSFGHRTNQFETKRLSDVEAFNKMVCIILVCKRILYFIN